MSICLFGYGLIGKVINAYLKDLGHDVVIYDKTLGVNDPNYPNLDNPKTLVRLIRGHNAVIAATPYYVNESIAVAAFDAGVSYFDLTEDTDTAEKIRTLNGINKARFYPQCGLAPGAVGIIANYLSTFFEEIYEIKLRVGALPITATNHIQYYLSWSPEGLVNEYYRLCPAIIDGISVLTEPLDGYEFLTLDGIGYEAFNTSGGAGDLISKLKHKNIKKLTYKTIRYPGHRDQILFLKEDLRLSKEEMIELLSKQLPHNHDDVVIIFVEVIGKQNGQLRRETYFKKIYGDRDLGISAIQKTTAAGVVSMVDCYLNEKIKKDEIVRYEDFVSNKYGLMYEF